MDNLISVTEIVAEDFKQGTSAKTGKPWSLSKYKASNGIEFSSFDKLEIGDVIVLEKNGEYWNGRKPREADKQHAEVMSALKHIYKEVADIKAKLSVNEVPKAPPKPDIATVSDEELAAVDDEDQKFLDSIPF